MFTISWAAHRSVNTRWYVNDAAPLDEMASRFDLQVLEISLSKIDKKAPLEQVCLLGCGISTGYGEY